jgi:hypothetical protein
MTQTTAATIARPSTAHKLGGRRRLQMTLVRLEHKSQSKTANLFTTPLGSKGMLGPSLIVTCKI